MNCPDGDETAEDATALNPVIELSDTEAADEEIVTAGLFSLFKFFTLAIIYFDDIAVLQGNTEISTQISEDVAETTVEVRRVFFHIFFFTFNTII